MALNITNKLIPWTKRCLRLNNSILNRAIQPIPVSLIARNIGVIKPDGVYDPQKSIEYETSNDKEEWSYVERALRSHLVPEPSKKDFYPSGWLPQKKTATSLPYYVRRSRNHMQPVYLRINNRGLKRVTHLRNIQGNIWNLHEDLKNFLYPLNNNFHIGMIIDEVGGKIVLKGDQVNNVLKFLDEKGF